MAVFEDDSVRKAVGLSDDEFMASSEARAARNRFGTGRMLRIMREVKRLYPHASVKESV